MGSNNSATEEVQNSGIEIGGLYKIFGKHPEQYMDAVKEGMSKQVLQEERGHVLGLKDINLAMEAGSIQVVMGLSSSGKSTLIRHINRLIDSTIEEVIVGGQDVCKMNPRALLLPFLDPERRPECPICLRKCA